MSIKPKTPLKPGTLYWHKEFSKDYLYLFLSETEDGLKFYNIKLNQFYLNYNDGSWLGYREAKVRRK